MYNEIKNQLKKENIDLIYLEQTDSTSSFVRRKLNEGYSGKLLVVAEGQTSGRGRNGKSFYSPEGTGLYFSVLLKLNCKIQDAVTVTTRASVEIARVIEKVTKRSLGIKWVNDLYFGGKKVCGILCEAVNDYKSMTTQYMIIGVGINLSTDAFPSEIQGVAGSLGVNEEIKPILAAEIARALFNIETGDLSRELLDEYRRRSNVLGRRIDYFASGEKKSALAVGIDSKGGLVIEKENGERAVLDSGEISVRIK